jgi:predicted nucleic acid-binding protein
MTTSPVLNIAISNSISAYDACYVELSERLKLPLVTADDKLIRTLEGTDYRVCSLMTFSL